MEILEVTAGIRAARQKWQYDGRQRPVFAEPTGAGEVSVWDYPRPPRLEAVADTLRVVHEGEVLGLTCAGMRVCETAGAPTYYFPPSDVAQNRLLATGSKFLCEWKGISHELGLGPAPRIGAVGWRYVSVFTEFTRIHNWVAFYPGRVECFVNDERVRAQPGGYYGGWVLENLRGPIKGEAGSEGW